MNIVKKLIEIREALWKINSLYGNLDGVINELADQEKEQGGGIGWLGVYETPHSIIYTVSGEIFYFGPFKTEVEALKYVDDHRRKEGVEVWELDLAEQYVYLIYPSHRQIHLSDKDFEGFQSDD